MGGFSILLLRSRVLSALALSCLLLCPAASSHAQLFENFDDGDLSSNPSWIGTLDRWQFLTNGTGLTLFTNGLAQSDTLFLTTESTVTAGSWSLDVGYKNGLLSNFNLIRIYLMASEARPDLSTDGFYLQLGSNDRDVRLYRNLGNGARDLLSQIPIGELQMDQQALHVEVHRNPDAKWEIFVDGTSIATIREESPRPAVTQYFGLWVKHTSSRREDMWFDNIEIKPDTTAKDSIPPSPYPAPIAGDLAVNEIYYAPPESDLEFVEILNTSLQTWNLCDVSIADSQSDPIPICRGEHLVAPGAYGIAARNGEQLQVHFPAADPSTPSSWPALNNSGDAVRLYAGGALLQNIEYQPSWGGQGVSLERRDPAGPAGEAFNWGSSLDPSGATPGRKNSLFAPDTTPPRLIFAELTAPQLITAVWNEPIEHPSPPAFGAGSQAPTTVEPIPNGVRLHFNDAVDAEELRTFGIADRTGNRSDEADIELARMPAASHLLINEIMFEPRADEFDHYPDQPEYIELVNRSERLLSLRGLALYSRTDESGNTDTLRSETAYPVLEAGGYAVLFASRGIDSFTEAFPSIESADHSLILLPVDANTLRLTNSGGLARIAAGDGAFLDEAIYSSALHHPDLIETRGIALERRSTQIESHLQSNWNSSTASEGGTPGRPNSIRAPNAQSSNATIQIHPLVFSPDGDGIDDVVTVSLFSESAPQTTTLRLYDAHGRLIRTLTSGTLAGHQSHFFWDGRSDSGAISPAGIYILLAEITNFERGRRERIKSTVVLAWKR